MPLSNPDFLAMLRCPVSRQPLHQDGNELVSEDARHRYPIDDLGIPYFAQAFCSAEGKVQEQHFDRIAESYIEHLRYPHTIEYTTYLDNALLAALPREGLGITAELCCGRGEALRLVGD